MVKLDINKLSQLDRIEYKMERKDKSYSSITPSLIYSLLSLFALFMLADIFFQGYGIEHFYLRIAESLYIIVKNALIIGIILDIVGLTISYISKRKLKEKYSKKMKGGNK